MRSHCHLNQTMKKKIITIITKQKLEILTVTYVLNFTPEITHSKKCEQFENIICTANTFVFTYIL